MSDNGCCCIACQYAVGGDYWKERAHAAGREVLALYKLISKLRMELLFTHHDETAGNWTPGPTPHPLPGDEGRPVPGLGRVATDGAVFPLPPQVAEEQSDE